MMPIRLGDFQLVQLVISGAFSGHISYLCVKDSRHSGQSLVDVIADPVGYLANLPRSRPYIENITRELLLFIYIVETKADFITIIDLLNAADYQSLRFNQAPISKPNLLVATRMSKKVVGR